MKMEMAINSGSQWDGVGVVINRVNVVFARIVAAWHEQGGRRIFLLPSGQMF